MKDIVLFRVCDSTTPLPGLRKRYRWMKWTIMGFIGCSIGMMEGFASIFILDYSFLEFVLIISCTAGSLLLAIPGIVLMPLADELEKELAARNALPDRFVSIADRMPGFAMKMMLLAALAVAAANLLH